MGTSLTNADGSKISDPEGKRIQFQYPNTLFVTLFNTGPVGEFEISYVYESVADSDETLITNDYQIEDTKSK